MQEPTPAPLLRSLPVLGRLGLSLLLLVILGGLVASASHIVLHHQNRDERPGLSLADVEGVYHGVQATAPLLTALRRDHPPDLPAAERTALLDWLASDHISESYDNLDLGENAPAEILDRACLQCHARNAEDPIGQSIPLEYWDDVRGVAFSRNVEPMAEEILVASAHTHALGMGALSLVLCLLAALGRTPPLLTGLLMLGSGAGLALDLGSWFLARDTVALIPVLIAGGIAWLASTALLCLVLLLDLWLPRRA